MPKPPQTWHPQATGRAPAGGGGRVLPCCRALVRSALGARAPRLSCSGALGASASRRSGGGARRRQEGPEGTRREPLVGALDGRARTPQTTPHLISTQRPSSI